MRAYCLLIFGLASTLPIFLQGYYSASHSPACANALCCSALIAASFQYWISKSFCQTRPASPQFYQGPSALSLYHVCQPFPTSFISSADVFGDILCLHHPGHYQRCKIKWAPLPTPGILSFSLVTRYWTIGNWNCFPHSPATKNWLE